MLNEHPRQQLQIIITRFGHSLCDNPKRCEAMLRDLCPEHKREVNLLVTALKEKIAHDLLNRPALMPLEATLKSLSKRLQDNHGTAELFANWAVESWALSLSVMQKPLPKQAVKPVENISPTQTKAVTSSSPQQQRIGKFVVRDGIVLDTETSLIWCRFAYGQRWENGIVKGNATKIDRKTAFDAVKQFNQHGGYAGYTDWRLPTIQELKTLIDNIKGKLGIYIDTDVFPENPGWIWSSSLYYPGLFTRQSGLLVDFENGLEGNYGENHSFAIRLVRNKTVAVVAVKPSSQTPKITVVTSTSAPAKIVTPPPAKKQIPTDAWLDELITWADKNDVSEYKFPRDKQAILALTKLILEDNKLTELPESIGKLTNLTKLILEDNKLTELPESIGKLTNLTYLSLGINQLTKLPESIGKLTNLTYLALDINQFTKLPESIGKLTNLTYLGLSLNQLTELPESIGNLTNLTLLALQINQLTKLPESIGKLTNLTMLILYENPIKSLPLKLSHLRDITSF